MFDLILNLNIPLVKVINLANQLMANDRFYYFLGRHVVVKMPDASFLYYNKGTERSDVYKIFNIQANKDHFLFSSSGISNNVFEEDRFRTLKFTDYEGNLISKNLKLAKIPDSPTTSQIAIDDEYYFLFKLLSMRLDIEANNIKAEIKKIKDAGINFPPTDNEASKQYAKSEKKGIEVNCMNVEIDWDQPFTGSSPKYEATQDNLVMLANLQKYLVYTLQKTINFYVRGYELWFYKTQSECEKRGIPIIFQGGNKWEKDFKLPRKRITWNRVKIDNDINNVHCAFRYRLFTKKI